MMMNFTFHFKIREEDTKWLHLCYVSKEECFCFHAFFRASLRTEYIITSSATCLKSHHVWQHIEMYYNFCFIAIKNRLSCFQFLLSYKNNTVLLFLFVKYQTQDALKTLNITSGNDKTETALRIILIR